MLFGSRVLCAFGFAFCLPAIAGEPNWQVMEWTAPLTVSVDADSIMARNARMTARVLWDYAQPQSTRDPQAQPFKSMIGLLVFDCITLGFGGAGGESYTGEGGTGRVVSQFSISPDEVPLSQPAPGSLAHDLVAFVCAKATGSS
jgi:hypothetical protein